MTEMGSYIDLEHVHWLREVVDEYNEKLWHGD